MDKVGVLGSSSLKACLCAGIRVFSGQALAQLSAKSPQIPPQASSQLLPVSGAVVPVRLVGLSSDRRAALKELTTGETRLAGKNDSAFGVVVQDVAVDAVVIGVAAGASLHGLSQPLLSFSRVTCLSRWNRWTYDRA
jgi:hypothetical protein